MRPKRAWMVGLGAVLASATACGGDVNDVGQLNSHPSNGGAGGATNSAGTGADVGAIAGTGTAGAGDGVSGTTGTTEVGTVGTSGVGGGGGSVGTAEAGTTAGIGAGGVGGGGGSAGTGQGGTAGTGAGAGRGGGGGSAGTGQGGTAGTGAGASRGGGGGSVIGGNGGDAGEINETDYACDSEIGCFVSNADDITAIAADDSNVYWTEHGTVDYLGNYLNDGRLLKRAFDSETTEVVATGLSGPVGLMLTTTDAYIYLDEFFQGSIRNALTRLPLTGGDATIVQLDVQPTTGYGAPTTCSASAGGTLYFPIAGNVYEIASADAKPTLFASLAGASLAVVGDSLIVDDGQIWTIPLTGGTPQLVADSSYYDYIRPAGSNFYTIGSCGNNSCLASMPQTGGPWTNLPNPWSGNSGYLQVSGNLFFHDGVGEDQSFQIYQGTLTDTTSAVVLFSTRYTIHDWVGTSAGVFWTDRHGLRLRTNDVQ